jgi:hypothetical protein
LLRKMIEMNDSKYGPASYILGAMLERKRILKVKTQLSRNGRRVFVYEHAKSGDLFPIEDPNLQLHQLETVQHEVLHLLQHGLETPTAEKPDNTTDGASEPTAEPVAEEPGARVAGVA